MKKNNNKLVLIRGGGDLASGVAAVLHRNGWKVVVSELQEPLVVRRKVSFAEAVWETRHRVEEISSVLTTTDHEIDHALLEDEIAVVIDPDAKILERYNFAAVVDARMLKKYLTNTIDAEIPVIGLGPGFIAGDNCQAVIETNRGNDLGKIIRQGSAQENSGLPGIVEERGLERVLYSPCEGRIQTFVEIGEQVRQGEIVAEVAGKAVLAPFDGIVRGMLRDKLYVREHTKVGDVDPRIDPSRAFRISEKALTIGEGVLEVVESLV